MTAQTPSIVIDKLGTHLLRVTNNHTGAVTLKWHWDTLLEEVQASCAAFERGEKPVTKDLVKETEAKVTKSRTKAAPAKKPAKPKAK